MGFSSDDWVAGTLQARTPPGWSLDVVKTRAMRLARALRSGISAAGPVVLLAGGLLLALTLAPTPAAPSRTALSAVSLLSGVAEEGIVENSWFVPPGDAAPATHAFVGTLRLSETEMRTEPELSVGRVFGKDPGKFPAVDVGFFTHNGDLVPLTQDVLRSGSTRRGSSYWDLIVQPGRVWSEPGDGGWSRAAFPFALVHSLEGETHNGLASFLYNDREVSFVSFQIVQQTSPYYVRDYFVAWGQAPADYGAGGVPDLPARKKAYEAELADRLPTADLGELGRLIGHDAIAEFQADLPDHEIIVRGIVHDDVLYHTTCKSAAGGAFPYCDRARFGVWSVTKSTAATVALLRLAEKYGEEVLSSRIVDYVDDHSDHRHWADVTFRDALNMATGIGHGTDWDDRNDISDGYMLPGYSRWYEAQSQSAKLERGLRAPAYPWGPGKVARYRDADVFILGAAMDALVREREDGKKGIWDVVSREVYRPIGIHHAPINRTIERNGAEGLPNFAFGQYLSLQDLAKIARLLHNGGRHDGEQILHAPSVEDLLYGTHDRGFRTGLRLQPRYYMGFWYSRHDSDEGCDVYIPEMVGWGGNLVALMPEGITGIRLGKNWDERSAASDSSGMRHIGDRLARFCPG